MQKNMYIPDSFPLPLPSPEPSTSSLSKQQLWKGEYIDYIQDSSQKHRIIPRQTMKPTLIKNTTCCAQSRGTIWGCKRRVDNSIEICISTACVCITSCWCTERIGLVLIISWLLPCSLNTFLFCAYNIINGTVFVHRSHIISFNCTDKCYNI